MSIKKSSTRTYQNRSRVSIGFAVVEGDQVADYDSMKHAAAEALNEAKRTGRNRVVVRPVQNLSFEQAG